MDHAGYGMPLVERGELDQSQHDAVRDVFTVPGPCTLVRADLFAEIGGFDEGISDFLDDVSLCWRAHIAGARVIVAPDAVARHRDALGQAPRLRRTPPAPGPPPAPSGAQLLRAARSCSGPSCRPSSSTWWRSSTRSSPGAAGRAGDVCSAWIVEPARGSASCGWPAPRCEAFRRVPDREVRREMARGSARHAASSCGARSAGGGPLHRPGRAAAATSPDDLQSGTLRASATVWAGVAVVLLAGSRHLITRGVPAVGEMVAFSQSPVGPVPGLGQRLADRRARLRGARADGVRRRSAGSGVGFLGAMGLLRTVLTLGMIPLGAFFAYRLPGAHRVALGADRLPARVRHRAPALQRARPTGAGARSCSTPPLPSLVGMPGPRQPAWRRSAPRRRRGHGPHLAPRPRARCWARRRPWWRRSCPWPSSIVAVMARRPGRSAG